MKRWTEGMGDGGGRTNPRQGLWLSFQLSQLPAEPKQHNVAFIKPNSR